MLKLDRVGFPAGLGLADLAGWEQLAGGSWLGQLAGGSCGGVESPACDLGLTELHNKTGAGSRRVIGGQGAN